MTATGGNITAPCHFQEQDQLLASLQHTCDNCGGRDHLMKMQPVSHGVFLFGEVSKDVLAVSQGVLSEERLRGCDGRDGTEVREVDAKSRKQAVLKDGE